MKGIILAGGKGTRLYPMTKVISKQLLPIFDKPLIYYPLSTLMLAGIKDVLVITSPDSINQYQNLLLDGKQWGMKISYKVQKEPRGLAEAFILGEEFIGNDSVCLILGDNFFYGHGLSKFLKEGYALTSGAMVFGCIVKNPSNFGVIEIDENNKVSSIEEKPEHPKSNLAVPGLYFFDNQVVNIAKSVKPSMRGELEITSVIEAYMKKKELKAVRVGRGLAWIDTGTPQGLHDASNLVRTIQTSQGFYIACLEEIAYNKGYISYEQLQNIGEQLKASDYGKYILGLEK